MPGYHIDRLVRVLPPRDAAPAVGVAAACCALAISNSTTSVNLANTLFGNAQSPATYGPCMVTFHAEGNDAYVLFGPSSTVTANSAAVSGNTQAARIPAGQDRAFELSPAVDAWMSARTQNGTTNTGTLRYRVTSFPSQGQPGSG